MNEIHEVMFNLKKLERLVMEIKQHERKYGENIYIKNPYSDFEVLEDFSRRKMIEEEEKEMGF